MRTRTDSIAMAKRLNKIKFPQHGLIFLTERQNANVSPSHLPEGHQLPDID